MAEPQPRNVTEDRFLEAVDLAMKKEECSMREICFPVFVPGHIAIRVPANGAA